MQRSPIFPKNQSETQIDFLVFRICEYLQENHQLTIPSECGSYLRRCLKQKDDDVKKTAKIIQAFQKGLKVFVEDWKCTLQPSLYSDFYTREFSFFNVLSQRDDEGRHVFLLRAEMWNPKALSFSELVFSLWMFLQYASAYVEDVQKNGYVVIWDFNNLTAEQGLAMGPSTVLAMMKWEQNETCGKMIAAHAVNHPRVVDMLFAGVKPFLNQEVKKRILFHKNVEDLLKHVPARILPSGLGGTAKEDSYRDNSLLKQLINQDKFFEDMLRYGFPTKRAF